MMKKLAVALALVSAPAWAQYLPPGVPNGAATLDSTAHLAAAQRPQATSTSLGMIETTPSVTGTPTLGLLGSHDTLSGLAADGATVNGTTLGTLFGTTLPDTYAPIASPALTGTPTAPTNGSATDASTQLATDAFTQAAAAAQLTSAGYAGGNWNNAPVVPTGQQNAELLADALDQGNIDIRNFAAVGAPYYGGAFTAQCDVSASGSTVTFSACSGNAPNFSGTSGWDISIDQMGAIPTTGPINGVGIVNGGSYPWGSAFPTITLANGGAGEGAQFRIGMAVENAALVSGDNGTGCPNGLQTFVAGGGMYAPLYVDAQVVNGSISGGIEEIPNPEGQTSSTILGSVSGTTLTVPGPANVTISTTAASSAINVTAVASGTLYTGYATEVTIGGQKTVVTITGPSSVCGTPGSGGVGCYATNYTFPTTVTGDAVTFAGIQPGTLGIGDIIQFPGVTQSVWITEQLTDTDTGEGGAGTYQLSSSPGTVALGDLNAGPPGYYFDPRHAPSSVSTLPLTPWGATPCTGAAPRIQAQFLVSMALVTYPGKNYSPSVTYSFSGGSPTVAPTPGSPTVLLAPPPLMTSVASAGGQYQVTLATAPSNVPTGQVNIVVGRDDAPAFNAARAAQNTLAQQGIQRAIKLPPGITYVASSLTPAKYVQGSVIGSGARDRSVLLVDPRVPSGNILECQDSGLFYANGIPTRVNGIINENTVNVTQAATGCTYAGLTVLGWNDSPNSQTAFAITGTSQYSLVEDADARNMTGGCFLFGAPGAGDTYSESDELTTGILYCNLSGSVTDTDYPAVRITSTGQQRSNDIWITGISCFGPGAQCMSIDAESPLSSNSSTINIGFIRNEAPLTYAVGKPNVDSRGATNADQMDFDSIDGVTPALNPGSGNINIGAIWNVSGAFGFAGEKFTAAASPSSSNAPYAVHIGSIHVAGPFLGVPVDVESCSYCQFSIGGTLPSSAATVLVGPSYSSGISSNIRGLQIGADRLPYSSTMEAAANPGFLVSADPSSASQVWVNGQNGDPADPSTGQNLLQNPVVLGQFQIPGCVGTLTGSSTGVVSCSSGGAVTSQTYTNSSGVARGLIGVDGSAETAPVVLPTSAASTEGGGNTTLTFATAPPTLPAGATAQIGSGGAHAVVSQTGDTVTISGLISVAIGTNITFDFNSGNNYILGCYNDGGLFLAACMSIERGTGAATFSATPSFPPAPASDNSTLGANTEWVENQLGIYFASKLGVANGAASLDNTGHLTAAQFPTAIPSATTATTAACNSTGVLVANQSYVANCATAASTAWAGGLQTGRYYSSAPGTALSSSAVPVALKTYVELYYLPQAATLKSLSVGVSVADTAAWNARVVVAQDASSSGSAAGGTVVADSGDIAVSAGATGAQTVTLGTPVALSAGWYWVVVAADTTAVSLESVQPNSAPFVQAQTGMPTALTAFTGAGVSGWTAGTLTSITQTLTTLGALVPLGSGVCPVAALGF